MIFRMFDRNGLEEELHRLSEIEVEAIKRKQLTEMLNRARSGGTPVDTGELRQSSSVDFGGMKMGYNKEYAAHVEYGHRTRSGGFVQGQKYLYKNVETQRPIYIDDIEKRIRKG